MSQIFIFYPHRTIQVTWGGSTTGWTDNWQGRNLGDKPMGSGGNPPPPPGGGDEGCCLGGGGGVHYVTA